MHSPERSKKALSILVVEDDRAAAELTCRLIALAYPDAVIHRAENGAVGGELFKKHLPDIVITDISMPVKNGIEMARTIKAAKADTRFIVLSAYNDKIFLEKFRELGIFAYLLKPLDLEQLLAAIDACRSEIERGAADRRS